MRQDHRQDPILFLVPIQGEGKSVEELETEAVEELRELAERQLSRLPASSSWHRAFQRMHSASLLSLERHPLRLVQPSRLG